jgi:hypothetical protein
VEEVFHVKQALELALSEGAKTLTEAHLKAVALHKDKVKLAFNSQHWMSLLSLPNRANRLKRTSPTLRHPLACELGALLLVATLHL